MNFISLFEDQSDIKVIDSSIDISDYTKINLSDQHTSQINLNLTDANLFEEFIELHLEKNNAKVAYGGYLEKRNLYKRSSVFNQPENEERNIHLGLDLWIKAGTNVLSALDGKIHSFQDNKQLGDYGPTIILEHQLENLSFYTLYGHLSLESLNHLIIGQFVRKGELIAQLGKPPINGDYAPHLHFQIILDMEGKFGDYPGVCSEKDLKHYKQNCPDPNLLLKIY